MAQRFNGTAANYLSRTASLLSINANFTWMAWVKITTDTNTNALIYSAGNNAGTQNDTVLLGADGTTLTLSVNAATTAGTNLTVGTWYHVALVRASTTDIKIYLNGVQDSSSTTNVGTSRTMENMMSGSFLGAATPFNGAMDSAKAWSRALSVAEIQNEMRRYVPISTTNLYAWWPMVHSTAALSAKDYGGTAADWTVNGTITVEQGAGIPWGGSPVYVQAAVTTDVTAALTGSSSSSAAGTLGVSKTVPLTGSQPASSAGTLGVAVTVALSGSQVASSAGTLSPASSPPLTGSASTSAAGTLAPASSVPLSGQAATSSAGTLTASTVSDVTVALTGQAVTVSAGTFSPQASVPLAGSASTASPGTLVAGNGPALAGSAATSSAGTLAPSASVALTGQSLAALAGNLSIPGDVTVALTGASITASAGNLSVGSVADAVSGGYWPAPPRRKRQAEVKPAPIPTLEQIEAAQKDLEARRALRRAEAKDRQVVEELRRIYLEQDALMRGISQAKAAIAEQIIEDEGVALILALAS